MTGYTTTECAEMSSDTLRDALLAEPLVEAIMAINTDQDGFGSDDAALNTISDPETRNDPKKPEFWQINQAENPQSLLNLLEEWRSRLMAGEFNET